MWLLALLGSSSASAFSVFGSEEAGVNPIRKIVTLLQDMQKEITAEGAKEQDLYDHFMCYCDGNTKGMEDGAKVAASRITELKSKLEAGTAEKQQLDQELMAHKQDRASAQVDLKNAQAIRDKERTEYEAAVGEQKQNLDALTGAIAAISKGSAQSLVQTQQGKRVSAAVKAASSLNQLEKSTVLSFFMEGQNPGGDYQAQGGEVVGILKNMKDTMDAELNGAVSEEEHAVAGFAGLASAKKAEIAAASEAIEAKTERAGSLAVENANCADEIEDTTQELSDTQAFLANLSVQCADKKREWEARVQSRADEILAISEAIKVLNDDDALDVFKKTLSLAQAPKAFLQKGREAKEVQAQAAQLVAQAQRKASGAQQQRLALLAYALGAKAVDFSKVLKMIDEMVETLKQEQVDDDAQKTFCENDLAESENRKKDVADELAASQALLAETQESSSAAAAEIESLKAEIVALDKAVAEATSQRIKEHEDSVQFSSESNLAVQLIAKAKGKLESFYRPKESLLQLRAVYRHGQRQAPEAPATWSAGPRATKEGKSNGVFALLDGLSRKLQDEIAEAERDEATSQKEYEGLMSNSQASRQQNVESITDLEAAKADLDTKAERTKEAETAHTAELANVEEYLVKLHANCDFLTDNYSLRKAARENESEALKNAKAVLAGADFA